MSLPGTQAPPKNKTTFRPPRALLGGRKARTLPPPPEKVSWNGLERQPVRPAPARTADVFAPPKDATDPAQLKRLGVYDYKTSALAMSLNHTDVTPTHTIAKIKKQGLPQRKHLNDEHQAAAKALAVVDKYADRPMLWDERVSAQKQDWRPTRPTLQLRKDAQKKETLHYVHDDRREAVKDIRGSIVKTGWRRTKERLDREEAHTKFLEKEEVKWSRLAERAFHRKVPAAKIGNRTEVGWWPHMKQDRDHTTSVKRRIKKRGKPAVIKANVKYDAWTDPSLKALLGKAERCQTLMVDGLPDRDVCRSMDTLKRLWTKGLDKEPYTPRGVTKPPLDIPKFAMGRSGGEWAAFEDEYRRDLVRRYAVAAERDYGEAPLGQR